MARTPPSLELAHQYYDQGDADRARATCQKLLLRRPHDAGALSLLGAIALDAERYDDAVGLLERAVRLRPTEGASLCNLGLAYAKTGALIKATNVLRKAVALDPTSTEALIHLGMVLLEQGQVEEGVRHLDAVARAAATEPSLAQPLAGVFSRLARSQLERGEHDEAVATIRRALELEPQEVVHHRVLAAALLSRGDLDGGLAALERVLSLAPDLASAHSSLIFHLPFSPRTDERRLREEMERWSARHATPLLPRRRSRPTDLSPERRLRVGYVSPDFRDHVQRLYMLPVLREHDRSQLEIVAYSSVATPDRWTETLRGHVDVWRDVAHLDDAALAETIRNDRVDVLVDLTMHMAHNRLRTFAERPAPVQLSWLAYPGSTGVDGIDYRLTDPFLDPPGAPLPYREETLRLPDTFWCYDPQSEQGAGPLPALDAGHVTFGCLNSFLKVSPQVLALWGRVLASVPRSKLLLLAPSAWARDMATEALAQAGVARDRLELVGLQSREDYLATYRRIDVGLDCVPYNGHTTSLDACWMGVPVVTRVGPTIVGRAGVSQARNLGLEELVATSDDELVSRAVALSLDLPRLASLREGLRGRLQRSPLMDAPRFTRALEAAFREAWRRYCETAAANGQDVVAPSQPQVAASRSQ